MARPELQSSEKLTPEQRTAKFSRKRPPDALSPRHKSGGNPHTAWPLGDALDFRWTKRSLLQGVAKRMYSLRAMQVRRCQATKADGSRCHAWAVWGAWPSLCVKHGGRSPYPPKIGGCTTRYQPCHCEAYNWPHRPGGGLCRWPDDPHYRWPKPAGTHSWPRPRNKELQKYWHSLQVDEMWLKRIAALPRRRNILALIDQQPSPSEILAEIIRIIASGHRDNGTPPNE